METVYSVEEDGDSENNQDPSESTENSECEERRAKNLGNGKGRLQDLYGSFERLAQEADSPPNERPRDESQQAQVKISFSPNIHLVATVFRILRFFFPPFRWSICIRAIRATIELVSSIRVRATSGNIRIREFSSPFENPLSDFSSSSTRLSVLSSYIFTIFAVFSESFEIKRSCNRVHRTLDSFS